MAASQDPSTLEDLAEVVLKSLELFERETLVKPVGLPSGSGVLVVASGNALPTGRILFGSEARVCNEGEYQAVLDGPWRPDAAVVISASGTKHAPLLVSDLLGRGIDTFLLTCDTDSPAAKLLTGTNRVVGTPSRKEPVTYNTSTYLGMILTVTGEDPSRIRRHIQDEVAPQLAGIGDYEAYYLMVRPEFDVQREMLVTKFDELFGGRVNGRCYTTEQSLHAKTVVPWDRELFISFGCENRYFGEKRLMIPLSEDAGFGEMLAVGYYVVGQIQREKPQWFKQNAAQFEADQKAWFVDASRAR